MKLSKKKIYFSSDDDFYKFCVDPVIVPVEYTNDLGEISHYMDFNFTKAYQDAVSKGKIFIIKDPDSKIFKHQAVSYRTITKPVDNLQQYFGFLGI